MLQVAGLVGLADRVRRRRRARAARGRPRPVRSGEGGMALGTVLLLGAVGDAVGSVLGLSSGGEPSELASRSPDGVGGRALCVARSSSRSGSSASTWLPGRSRPSPARSSDPAVVRAVDSAFPPPPSLAAQLGSVLDLIGFPDVFSGLPPLPADPVPQPPRGLAARAARAARPSMVLVAGPACDRILQGTGFVVEDDLVLTNAHVIAGSSPRVEWEGGPSPRYRWSSTETSTPRSCGSTARTRPHSRCWPRKWHRGTGGAVLGYPHGRIHRTSRPRPSSVGCRRARHLFGGPGRAGGSTSCRPRSSRGTAGGRSCCPAGQVAGLIFGASVTNEDLGYAITSPELIPLVDRATVRTDAVGTGRCVRLTLSPPRRPRRPSPGRPVGSHASRRGGRRPSGHRARTRAATARRRRRRTGPAGAGAARRADPRPRASRRAASVLVESIVERHVEERRVLGERHDRERGWLDVEDRVATRNIARRATSVRPPSATGVVRVRARQGRDRDADRADARDPSRRS